MIRPAYASDAEAIAAVHCQHPFRSSMTIRTLSMYSRANINEALDAPSFVPPQMQCSDAEAVHSVNSAFLNDAATHGIASVRLKTLCRGQLP